MSYIAHKEKIFSSKKKNIVRKRSDCSLRSIASCTDSRAWGSSAHDLRQYILETINGSTSSVGKFIPPKVLIDILIKQKSNFKKNYNIMKKKSLSSENLNGSKKSTKLDKAELGQGDFKRDNDDEVSNLRRLVKDLRDQLVYLENVKEENLKLKGEVNSEAQRQLEEALMENRSLTAKLEAYSNLVSKNQEISKMAESFKADCQKLRKEVEELNEKNTKLGAKIRDMMRKRNKEKVREMAISTAKVDNSILRERLISKEDKIKFLGTVVEHQELQITELVSQIEHMATAFAWKEERMVEKLDDFKRIAEVNCDKAYENEKKLALCEMLIKELETMRNQFRYTNCMLKENMIFYKNQFEVVAAKGQLMGDTIKELMVEISTKDDKIQKLSHFPPTTKTIVYFSQLKGLLQDDAILQMDANSLRGILKRMREILLQLNQEAWVSQGIELPISLCDSVTQTICELKDTSCQHFIVYKEIHTQTHAPEELVVKYITAGLIIKVFIKVIKNLELSIERHKQNYEDIEKEFMNCLDEKLLLEDSVQQLKKEVDLCKETNSNLMDELKTGNESNSKIISSLENKLELYKEITALYDLTMKECESEHSNHSKVLEVNLEVLKEQIKNLSFYIQNDLNEQRKDQANYTDLLEKNLLAMEKVMVQEVEINRKLENEVFDLNDALLSKDEMFRKAMQMLETSEKNLSQLEQMLNHDDYSVREINFESELDSSESSQFEKITECLIEREHRLNLLIEEKSSLEEKLGNSNRSCERFKKIILRANVHENILKKKLYRINLNVKRVKRCLTSLRLKLNKSSNALDILKTSNEQLVKENHYVYETNIKLQKENENHKKTIVKTKKTISTLFLENEELSKEKQRMGEAMEQFCVELESYKKMCEKIMVDSGTTTEETMKEYDDNMKAKEDYANDLVDQVNRLTEQISEIENERKAMSFLTQSNQTAFEVDNRLSQTDDSLIEETDKYTALTDEMKSNYENIIDTLQKEHLKEMERENKQYLNNLSMLKETYERDIKRIKSSHAESLKKMQSFHEEEIESLKRANQEGKIKEIDISSLEEKNKIEIDKMKRQYEDLLEEKTKIIIKEKEMLQEEMGKYLAEKDMEIQEITKQMDINLKNVKKKCRTFVKKIQYENSMELENLNKEFESRLEEEIKRRQAELNSAFQTSVSKNRKHDQDLNSEESEDCYLDTIPILEHKTETSPTIADDRRCLLRRISQLEEELLKKDLYASENACDTEKRIWKERERCKEVSCLLDREVERNEKLRAKLSVEYHKVAELELLNLSLKRKLARHMDRDKRKPRKFDKLDFTELNLPNILSEDYGSDYSNLTVEFIQQCGIHHNTKQTSKDNFNDT